MASLGGGPPRVTPEGKKFLWANLQRIVEKRDRTGKKLWRLDWRVSPPDDPVTPE